MNRWVFAVGAGIVAAVAAYRMSLPQRKAGGGKAGKAGGEPHEKKEVDALLTELRAIGAKLKPSLGFKAIARRIDDSDKIPEGGSAKKVHFIRHGQGYHNLAQRTWREAGLPGEPYTLDTDPERMYLDSKLTAFGEEQAIDLRGRTEKLNPELMVVSPLRRATQTGLLAFAKHVSNGLRVVAHESCHEVAGLHTCDRRLGKSDLSRQFPAVDYSLLEEEEDPFWGDGWSRETNEHLASRAADFMKWVKEQPEKHIVVASHSQFLFTLFNAVLSVENEQDAIWFGTGEMRTMAIEFQ